MFELSAVPKTTGRQLINQAAASLLWYIKWLTNHGGQIGEFGYTMGDVSYVAMIAMLTPHIQDAKLRETLHTGVSQFLDHLTTPAPCSACVAWVQNISTLAMYGTPVTEQAKQGFKAGLGQCKQEGCIKEGQYALALAEAERLPVPGGSGLQQPPHNTY